MATKTTKKVATTTGKDTGGNSFSIPSGNGKTTSSPTKTTSSSSGGLQYTDIVQAQGGIATNPQTGAVTYSTSNAGSKSARDVDAVVDSTGAIVKAAKPSTYPVLSADMAKTDLLGKQTQFNDILAGMQQQQLANTQTNVTQGLQQQQIAANTAAGQPSDTLNDIKNLVSGAVTDQKSQLGEVQKKQDQAYADYKTQVDQIRKGTFPLTPDQSAIVDYTQRQFDRLAEQQKMANQNFEGGMAQLGITSGRSRYAPEIQLGLVQAAVSDGITKIADIEAKAALTVADLRQGFQDKNYALINDSYDRLNGYLKEKTNTINQMASIVKEEANFALTMHQQEMAEAKDALAIDQANQEFNLKYNIPADKQFYAIGGTVYRASDRKPAHNPEEYVAMGGKGDFSDVFELTGNKAAERDLVLSMAQKNPEAGIRPGDDITIATAKLQASKLEEDDTDTEDMKPDQATIDDAGSQLQSRIGSDGYISPEDWNLALENWTDSGYSADSFVKSYKKYINKANPQDYNNYALANGDSSTQNNSGNQVKGWSGTADRLQPIDGFKDYAKIVGTGQIITGSKYHTGGEVDIDGKIGDPIPAFEGGTVIAIKKNKDGYGNEVIIRNDRGETIIYGHLSSFNVKRDQRVPAGYRIGNIGNSGNVVAMNGGDGSHLHIEKRDKNGKLVALR